MQRSYSVASARAKLAEIIDEVESGEDVEIVRRGNDALSRELEGFAELELGAAIEGYVAVWFGGEAVGARVRFGREVRAVLAREAEAIARRFVAQALVDARDHGVKGWAGWPRWKKKRK